MLRNAARRFVLFLLFLCVAGPLSAQEKLALVPSLFDAFVVRPIGPANMGGRIVDVAVVDANPATMYFAAATGGLWKTVDAGKSWTPLMDHLTNSLGAVALAPSNPDIVWAGGGESNPRNSATFGDGVYKSTDGGKTWQNMGLAAAHHIGRIAIHPTNSDIVYVSALGHVWGPNKERGLFKTEDGGKTWQHSLALDDDTGCIDVAIDPSEPDIVYTAAYAVRRDTFSGGNPLKQTGPHAGLYKTSDGGKKWERMGGGLPKGPYGRCGLAIYAKNPKVIYAVVQTDKTTVTVAGQLPNQKLDVNAGGVFRSEDQGKTWTHVNSLCPRPFYYGQIRIDPSDDKTIYVLGVSFFVSNDGGRKFGTGAKGVHVDHHALWINPKDSKHLILGNDGGLYISKKGPDAFEAIRGFALGQFYAIGVDMRKPYRVYGGLQDNGSWGGPSATNYEKGITVLDWFRIGGGDGFYCLVDPTDPNTVYCEMQYGGLKRVDVKGAGGAKTPPSKAIKPGAGKDGKSPYRFNWNSPLVISPHQPQTLYYGGNVLLKSVNRGDNWNAISPDLTGGKIGMASTGHTLTTIAESPTKAGVLYVGADTGKLHVTRDDGKTWNDITGKLPKEVQVGWVTRVECSHHAEGTAYVTIDRHRNDDQKPYLFKTTDFGETWQPIVSDLPIGPVQVVRESSVNPQLLFVGNEFGVYVSLNGGASWSRFGKGLPVVPVYDLVIHPRDRDLVIATHGRSIYVVDIGPLEELSDKAIASPFHLFKARPATAYVPRKSDVVPKNYVAPNPPLGAALHYYLKERMPARLVVLKADGSIRADVKVSGEAGLNKAFWPFDPSDLPVAGTYQVELRVGDRTTKTGLLVEREEDRLRLALAECP